MEIKPKFTELESLVKKMGAEKQHAQIKKEYAEARRSGQYRGYVSPNPRDIPGRANKPTQGYGGQLLDPKGFVEYHDAGPQGEMYQEMDERQRAKRKQEVKYQTKGKKSLLTSQPTKSKGGGKSGGGGKLWGLNILRRRSPWHHLKRLLE